MLRLLAFILSLAFAYPQVYAEDVLPADGIPWAFEQPSRIVAIGDIHADPDALLQILTSQHLIDSDGHWIGKDAHLVLIGDIFDRGPRSRPAIDLIMRLEKEAEAANGKVHTLLGNHDVMVPGGDLRYAKQTEKADYLEFQNTAEGKDLLARGYSEESAGFRAAFTGNTEYAKWIRSRNSIIKIGTTVFAHAGIGAWPESLDPAEINATARACIHSFQTGGPKIESKYYWVIKGISGQPSAPNPMWMRELADQTLPEATLDRHLSRLGAQRVVIGHSATSSGEIETRYQGKVICVDTNNSIGYASKAHGLSALEIQGVPNGNTFQTGAILPHSNIPRELNPHPLANVLTPTAPLPGASESLSCAAATSGFSVKSIFRNLLLKSH